MISRRPPLPVSDARGRRHAGRRLRSVVGQVSAFVWGEERPVLPGPVALRVTPARPGAATEQRHVEIARITGPVAADVHPAPTPSADKRSAIAHYRAMAEQVARERRGASTAALPSRGRLHGA